MQHSVFTLTAPDRLVIDINGATLGAPLNVNTSNTPITAMRSAQRTPTDLRVVIDLKKAVTPKSFSLAPNAQYGNRLVVDLFDNAADAAPTASADPIGRDGAGRCRSLRWNLRSSCRLRRPASATSLW